MKKYIDGLVSIITPVYNSEKYLEETIVSVLNQSYSNWELILVNDCSTDNSEYLIKKMTRKSEKIILINLEENSGAAVARNTALDYARGQYIAFLDSDDLWEPSKLDKQIKFMRENNYSFTFTDYSLIAENGENYNKINNIIHVPKKINYNFLLKNTIILCSSVVIDRKKIGDFSMPLLRAGQDTATWLKLLKRIDYAHGLNQNLCRYRQRENSISSNKFRAVKRTWHLYRNVERLSLIKSSYVFCCYAYNAVKKRV